MAALTQTAAKRECREVSQTRQRAYVEDKAPDRYLTVDYVERAGTGPSVEVSAHSFGRTSRVAGKTSRI